MGEINLSEILSELIDVEKITGCGFGDKNGLTLAVTGSISRYFYTKSFVVWVIYVFLRFWDFLHKCTKMIVTKIPGGWAIYGP